MIKNQVAILDKIGETAWAIIDNKGWLLSYNGIKYHPSRAAARDCARQPGLMIVKVKLVLA